MLAFLSALAWAAPSHANLAVGDFDGDGRVDIAIGLPGSCGTIEVWLSSEDSQVGLPREIDPAIEVPMTPGTLLLRPSSCDASFGLEVVTLDGERGALDRIGTLLDKRGEPTTEVGFERARGGSWAAVWTDTGNDAADACEPCSGSPECCDYCEPCSGPSYCCDYSIESDFPGCLNDHTCI